MTQSTDAGMNKSVGQHALTSLSPAESRLIRGLLRPRRVAIACLVLLTGAGWTYLGLALAGHKLSGTHLGTLAWLSEALCHPSFGSAPVSAIAEMPITLVMWVAMTLAMMLPTAAPMILTYAEIADTAAKMHKSAASTLFLTAGYLVVWIGFALAVTAVQIVLTQAALLDTSMRAVGPLFSGVVFLAAGAYQFSQLKHACVTRCQRPFPFFLANWSTRAADVFRLGLRQGLYCLGCCWAIMLVMFAVGVMNVVWMALLGLIMAGEKIGTTTRLTRLTGVAFGLIGVAFVFVAVFHHWPTHFTLGWLV
jgi:predicted metal-binding membrane protein